MRRLPSTSIEGVMCFYDYRSQEPEARFIAMMKDFCQTYDNKPASTEDFKVMVEKHMTPSMERRA